MVEEAEFEQEIEEERARMNQEEELMEEDEL